MKTENVVALRFVGVDALFSFLEQPPRRFQPKYLNCFCRGSGPNRM
jgi:hypothetical protein